MDPFMMGLLSMFASGNPGQAGPLMDALGVPLPGSGGGDPGAGGLGQIIPGAMGPFQAGTDANAQAQTAQGVLPAIGANMQTAMSDPNTMKALAGMQGVVRPEPVKPIMSGGVSGGVAVPKASAGGAAASSPALQMLMSALLSGDRDPLRVPQLGALMRR